MKKVPSAQHPSLPPLFRAPSSVDNMGSDCCNTPSSPVLTLPFRVLCNTWTAAPPTLWLQYLWLIQRHLRKPPSRPQTFFLSDAFFCLSFCPVTSGISTHFFYLLLFFFSVVCSIFKSKKNLSTLTNGRASTTNAIWKKKKYIYIY